MEVQEWFGTYEFPHGLPGFPALPRWRLEAFEAPFFLLSAEGDEHITLPLIVPEFVVNPFHLQVSSETWAYAFGDLSPQPEDLLVLVVVTLRDPVTASTANLLAPIVFDRRQRRAAQIPQETDNYPLRAPLFREEDGRARPFAQGR